MRGSYPTGSRAVHFVAISILGPVTPRRVPVADTALRVSRSSARNALALGIDLGTQSTKVLIYDPSARAVLQTAQSPHDIILRSDGTSEQDAGWWIRALSDCMDRLDSHLKQRVGAIGVSGQQHGLVALDGNGHVVHNVKLWNDTTTQQECDDIMTAYGGKQRFAEQLGNPLLPGYTATKVLWLKRHAPTAYAAVEHILLPHDYLNYFLTGNYTAEARDASGTGFFDVRVRRWSDQALHAIDAERNLLDTLPPLIAPDAPSGRLRPRAAAMLGLSPDTWVSAGGGDNMMAALGTGCAAPGVFTVSLGTSGTLFGYANRPIVDNEQLVAAFCSSTGGWLPLVCTMNCTVATELNRALFELPVSEVDALASSVPVGCDGLITLHLPVRF